MFGWTQREIVTTAAIGVVFGVIYLAIVQVWLVLQGIIGPLAMDLLLGLWCTASVVAAYIIRKPFAAFFAEVIAAAAQVAMGNPAGLMLILTGVVQGAGAEVAFAATRWKRYDLPVLLASGAGAAIFSFAYTWIRFNYGALDGGLLAVMFVLRVASGMIFAGLLGLYIAKALQKTGALRGLAIDSDRARA